jgi:hypothetical protein
VRIRAWSRRNARLFALLPGGNVFAVKGAWWVGEINGYRARANWKKR